MASVLSMKPEILVLDEPTSNLDPKSKAEVVTLIGELKREGTTILTAIHDVNIVPQIADKVLLLDRNVVEFGDARRILREKDLLKHLGLDVPTIVDLFYSLRGLGCQIENIPLTKEEALDALSSHIIK